MYAWRFGSVRFSRTSRSSRNSLLTAQFQIWPALQLVSSRLRWPTYTAMRKIYSSSSIRLLTRVILWSISSKCQVKTSFPTLSARVRLRIVMSVCKTIPWHLKALHKEDLRLTSSHRGRFTLVVNASTFFNSTVVIRRSCQCSSLLSTPSYTIRLHHIFKQTLVSRSICTQSWRTLLAWVQQRGSTCSRRIPYRACLEYCSTTTTRPICHLSKLMKRQSCMQNCHLSKSWGKVRKTVADIWLQTWWQVSMRRLSRKSECKLRRQCNHRWYSWHTQSLCLFARASSWTQRQQPLIRLR